MSGIPTGTESVDRPVDELIDELDDLVCMLSMHDDLMFQEGAPGSGWYFQPSTRIVNADGRDLRERGSEYCRGLATHEAAHAAITRYHDLVPNKLFRTPALPTLMNVIEDCRIEEWMQRRLPGCAPWVELYNNILFAPFLTEEGLPQSASGQFCMSILGRWWHNEDPPNMLPIASDALEEAWPEVRRAIDAQPPASLVEGEFVKTIYRQHPSSKAYLGSDLFQPPSGIEMMVRMYQFNMWGIIYRGVLPIFERLNEYDRKQQGQNDMADLQRLLNGIRPVPSPGSLPAGQRRRSSGGGWSQSAGGAGGGGAGGVASAIEQALAVPSKDRYLQTWKKLYPQIDQLSEDLIRVLESALRAKWIRFQDFGSRLDLRMVMQYQADRTLYDRLWMKRNNPKRIDPGFIILLDTSGSMSGTTIEYAFEGVVLITEVCARLGIPVDIWTFNNSAQRVHQWDNPIDENIRGQLGAIVQRCDGGTNMSAAIDQIADQIDTLPHKDKAVFVLGDGAPNNPTATTKAVRNLESRDCAVVGLGMGSGTKELGRFFSSGMYDVPVERVATSLAELLSQHFNAS